MDFYRKAISVLKQADEFDTNHKYEDALKSYVIGIEYLLTGIKYVCFF